jgi:hypothetical protein
MLYINAQVRYIPFAGAATHSTPISMSKRVKIVPKISSTQNLHAYNPKTEQTKPKNTGKAIKKNLVGMYVCYKKKRFSQPSYKDIGPPSPPSPPSPPGPISFPPECPPAPFDPPNPAFPPWGPPKKNVSKGFIGCAAVSA